MKTVEIKVPNGYELKQVSDGKWELVKEELTLWSILKHSYSLPLTIDGAIENIHYNDNEQQLKKLSALSKLQCVADYLNDDWQPDWDSGEHKCFIAQQRNGVLRVYFTGENCGSVYFKSEELAKQAIEICGEDLIRTALGV